MRRLKYRARRSRVLHPAHARPLPPPRVDLEVFVALAEFWHELSTGGDGAPPGHEALVSSA